MGHTGMQRTRDPRVGWSRMGKILEQERTVHDHRVRFLQAGAGPPIVLIHGITSSADTWVPAMTAAAGGRTLIAPAADGIDDAPRGCAMLAAGGAPCVGTARSAHA